jgi:diguanylate cyclase (GGDEF)-like protein
MIVNDSLKDKVIIVAGESIDFRRSIEANLKAGNFHNVLSVAGTEEIFHILKRYYEQPERVGLIVISENLPASHLEKLSQVLNNARHGYEIPFIIISQNNVDNLTPLTAVYQAESNCSLLYRISFPVNEREFLLAVNCLLNLKQERFWRFQQKEQLLNEIAAKTVIDAKLQYLVAHDELTGLFNRGSFESQLRQILKHNLSTRYQSALLLIDIDRFSLINELEGFDIGDQLLVELAIQIRKLLPAGVLFARIGSDEFCLFLEQSSKSQAVLMAETIRNCIDEYQFTTSKSCFSVAVSVGVALSDQAETVSHPGEMILHARQACHFAKANGRDRVRVYSNLDHSVKERRRDIYWVPLIRKALRENSLFLVFQPVVDLLTNGISHYEVLLRMMDDGVIISPNKFIPAAERMGLIHSIDLWVVESAIDFLAKLPPDLADVSLAINLSSLAFQYPDLLSVISDKLIATHVDANRLIFEITETAAFDSIENAIGMMSKIHALGCKFALDDFGAGFCSFNYLKTFPVEYVKIDGQFIINLQHDETDQILVKSMVDIAEKLGKKTIAEFVESSETVIKLKELGVNCAQGYVYGRPEPFLQYHRHYAINSFEHNSLSTF